MCTATCPISRYPAEPIYLLWIVWTTILTPYTYESEWVCTCNHRDKAGKQQRPFHRVHPHRGLVTRWAAGSPLSLASWGRLSAGNSESSQKEDFHLLISPHNRNPAAAISRGWFKTENYLDINSYDIIMLLWWASSEGLKRWLENRTWVIVSLGGLSILGLFVHLSSKRKATQVNVHGRQRG